MYFALLRFSLIPAKDALRYSRLQFRDALYRAVFQQPFNECLLTKSGLKDFFASARGLQDIDPDVYKRQILRSSPNSHVSFVSVTDYFYNSRRQTDQMLRKIRLEDLTIQGQESGLSIGELWLKVERYLNSVLFGAESPQRSYNDIENGIGTL